MAFTGTITLHAQDDIRLSDHVTCAPLDIAIGKDGAIQVFKDGVGQLYSPSNVPYGGSLYNSFILAMGTTTVGATHSRFDYTDYDWDGTLSAVSGSGIPGDPWVITAYLTTSLADAELQVDIEYINGEEYFDYTITPTVPSSNTQIVKVYHVVDTYLNGSDDGAAYVLGSAPYDFVGVEATTGGLYEGFIKGNLAWDHYASERYTLVDDPEFGTDLSDNLDFDPSTDNGIGVQWTLGTVSGTQPAITYKFSFTTNPPVIDEICGNALDDNNDGRVDEEYPNGVQKNMLLWVKADEGFSGAVWEDQSPNGNDGTNVGSPTQVTSLNFNYGIEYDGSNYTYFNLPELAFEDPDQHIVIFSVYKPANNLTTMGIYGNQAGGANNININNESVGTGSTSGNSIPELYGNEAHLTMVIYDEEDQVSGSANSSHVYVNGVLEESFAFDEDSGSNVNSDFYVGVAGTNAASQNFTGEILELIIYHSDAGTEALNSTERAKVSSYLSKKYGISMPSDYLGSQ